MKLVKNWKAIAARSHSMWSIYLGIIVLLVPDILYLLFSLDTSPRLWFVLGLGLLIYGAVGRVKDQGIDRDRLHSPAWIVLLVVLIGAGGAVWTGQRPAAPAPPPPVAAAPQDGAETLAYAVPLVSKWEGLRTVAYRDPVGIWTICYGETQGVTAGMVKTEMECAAMLSRRLLEFRAGLHRHLTSETLAGRLPPPRDAAYTSFAYNVGVPGAGGSTAVRRLNAGDIAGGCEALTWWNKAGGRVLRGLVARRTEERDLCRRGLT